MRYELLILSPDKQLISLGFDGIKNYFTTAWHLKHDTQWHGYSGMNHPYGEHVLFTDNQPVLANAAKLSSFLFPAIKDHGVGLINLFQIFSILFSVFCFVVLFRRLELPGWYGALASFLLVLLSPQHLRFDAHFGLSHIWVISLIVWMLHTYEFKTYRRRISFKIGLVITLVSQLHMYYFGLFFLFLTIYHLLSFLRDPHATRFYKRFVHWALMLLVPYGILRFWLNASHSVSDRSTNPYGFHAYKGHWEGLFLPYPEWPVYQWIDKNLIKIRVFDGEASAYVGAFATMFFLLVLFSGFRVFRKQKDVPYGERLNRNYLRNLWWAAVILACFVCGIPHELPGFEWITDYYGPIRQFRSMGRFNWVLFTVFNITAFYWLWHFAETRQRIWVKAVCLILPFTVLASEAWQHQSIERSYPTENRLTHLGADSLQFKWMQKLNPSEYQALLPLPYYHVGSENFVVHPKDTLFLYTQRAAYASGVPDMGVYLSRTSLNQTINQLQLHFDQVELPRILLDMEDDKPLAIITLSQDAAAMQAKHPYLFSKALPIHEDEQVMLWKLPIDSLRLAVRQGISETKSAILAQKSEPNKWKTEGAKFFRHENYDGLKTVNAPLIGTGALRALQSDSTFLYLGNMPKGKYLLSLWIDASTDQSIHAHITVTTKDKMGTQTGYILRFGSHEVKAIKDGWALVEFEFEVPNEQDHVRIMQYKKGVHFPIVIDECQIRPVGVDAYFTSEHYLSKNNRWYVD